MRLISPVCRFQIGEDVFTENIREIEVGLGEDDLASTCRISLYDPGLVIGARYSEISFRQGGIIAPLKAESNVSSDSTPATPTSTGTTSSVAAPGYTQSTSIPIELRAFLDLISYTEGAGYNTMFTGKTFSDFSRHPHKVICSGRLCSSAAGRYQFLDRTWDSLARSKGFKDFKPETQDLAGIELIRNRGALEDVKAGRIESAILKCNKEWASFPGSPYGQPTKKMYQCLAYYKERLDAYKSSASTPLNNSLTSITPTTPTPTTPSPPVEITKKGTEIIIELGYSLDQLISFHFIHTGTDCTKGNLDITEFSGQAVRWLLTRRVKNSTYTNITLKQLAQMVASRYGLALEMEGSGPTYQHLDQTGITDYELLLRECRSIGYTVTEDKNKLVIQPVRPKFTGFAITKDIVENIRFGDKADIDRDAGSFTTVSTLPSATAQASTKIDKNTGNVTTTPDKHSQTATGANNHTTVVGSATSAVKGSSSPTSTTTNNTNNTVKKSVSQKVKEQRAMLKATPTTPSEDTKVHLPIDIYAVDESIAGFPKQEVGAIDLGDGRAEAQALSKEQQRVKGFESEAQLLTTPESLSLVPGSIIAVAREVAPLPFSREWRVSAVKHSLSSNGFKTSLNFYSPQAPRDGVVSSSTTNTTNTTTTSTVSNSSIGLINPVPGATKNNPGGYAADTGLDILCPIGTRLVAPLAGVVCYAEKGHNRQQEQDANPNVPGFQISHSVLIKIDKSFTFEGINVKYVWMTHMYELNSKIFNKGTDKSQPVRLEAGEFVGLSGSANKTPHLHIGFISDRRQTPGTYLKFDQVKRLIWS